MNRGLEASCIPSCEFTRQSSRFLATSLTLPNGVRQCVLYAHMLFTLLKRLRDLLDRVQLQVRRSPRAFRVPAQRHPEFESTLSHHSINFHSSLNTLPLACGMVSGVWRYCYPKTFRRSFNEDLSVRYL